MRALAAAFLLLGVSAPALAQPAMDPDALMARLEASQAQAQAGAQRPGDEALTCGQLEAEFTAIMSDPQFRQAQAEMGVWAQSQMQRAQGARGQAMASVGVGMAMGLASAFVPGLGMASSLAMRAQSAMMQRQTEANQAEIVAQMGSAQAMMPAAYRGERLYGLAQARQCSFLQEGAAPGGGPSPDPAVTPVTP